ncbi:MAG: hypothetical protein IJP32_11225 [Clostridia bacterium]|nr:hypothetical protein [Clostridia bacterium]
MENEQPMNAGEQSSISQMVEQIMKNPELTGIINELRGGTGNATPVSQTEILSHLPDVMAMLKPFTGGQGEREAAAPEKEEKSEPVPKTEEPAKAVSAVLPKKYDKNRAEKLMGALKPYLSRDRCEIIDKCVSVIQITDIVEALQGLEGLTKPKP